MVLNDTIVEIISKNEQSNIFDTFDICTKKFFKFEFQYQKEPKKMI